MTDTIISSATREVVIGFDRPFVIIGERINPTGRKILAAEMAAGDFSRVEAAIRVMEHPKVRDGRSQFLRTLEPASNRCGAFDDLADFSCRPAMNAH